MPLSARGRRVRRSALISLLFYLPVSCTAAKSPPVALPAVTVSPSATEAAPALTAQCESVYNRISRPTNLALRDPVSFVQQNRLARLPVRGLATRKISDLGLLKTPDDYVASAVLADPEARIALMERDGFRGGINVGFVSGPDHYGAIILRFRNGAAAKDYFKGHLADICTLAVSLSPIKGLAGVAFLRNDDLARAAFVVGDTEVNLDVCSCVQVQDRTALAARWAQAVALQFSRNQSGNPPTSSTV